jgi:hypothetical protein
MTHPVDERTVPAGGVDTAATGKEEGVDPGPGPG